MKRNRLLLMGSLSLALAAAPMAAQIAATPVLAQEITNATQNHTYKAYQIFAGDYSGDTWTNIEWGNGVDLEKDIDGKTLIAALAEIKDGEATPFAGKTSASEIAGVLETNKDNATVVESFRKTVYAYIKSTPTAVIPENTETPMPNGYYLLVDSTDVSGQQDAKNLNLLVNATGKVNIQKKYDLPTLDKKVEDEGTGTEETGSERNQKEFHYNADHDLQEEFKFQLTAKIPANTLTEYDTYKLIFNDTASVGVDIKQNKNHPVISSIKVANYANDIEETSETYTSGFEVSEIENNHFTVTINDLKSLIKDHLYFSKEIRVIIEYAANLNDKADISNTSLNNKNEAFLQYSNNPNSQGEGETGQTPPAKVFVGSYVLNQSKTDESQHPLPGAKFSLKNVKGEYAQFKAVDGKTHFDQWVSISEDAWKALTGTDKEKYLLISGDNGDFSVHGLDTGTYTLNEEEAPAGYNKLTAPIPVTITAAEHSIDTKAEEESASTSIKILKNGTDVGTAGKVVVENGRGSTLPETGGMGTTLLYTAGSLLAGGAAVLYITNKRMRKD